MNTLRFTCIAIGLALLAPAALITAGCDANQGAANFELPPLDVENPPLPDVVDSGAAFGEACVVAEDCISGLCSPAADGSVCTELCDGDSCADGFACETLNAISICVADSALACQPCTADAQCNLPGKTGNSCIDYGEDGQFCGLACTGDEACPQGFSCDTGQCRKSSGSCSCNAAGNGLEMATTCSTTNDFGTCDGDRMCSSSGLTRCDAPAPAEESCNGLDDNCDGSIDEDTGGNDCEIANEFGTCVGAVECTEGAPICVGRAPAAEVCDGVDNDCDGLTDEDQADLDNDMVPDCTDDDIDGDGSLNDDDCKPYDAAIYPGASETCNGIDDDCNIAIDDGTDANDQAECDSYICGGPEGCRDDCLGDVHCTSGYKCDLGDDDDNGNSNECLPSVCGNGSVDIQEVCDDGINDGSYGSCMPGCQAVGPTCGDGVTQPGDEACDDGGDNGQPNKCNLTCSGPTSSTCGNGTLEAGETCDDGDGNSNDANAVCRTDCTPQRCGDGVVDSQNGETCDEGNSNSSTVCGCQSSCTFAPQAVPCRASAGACDIAESCNGNGSCPADTTMDAQTPCRDADGVCDAVEFCTGDSATCPADAKEDAQTVCRDAGDNACDITEHCTGSNDDCPADEIAGAGASCRDSVGLCDIAEVCDGSNKACPMDVLHPSNVACRDADGSCDVAEFCDGSSGLCPSDATADSGVICRQKDGGCDVAEACDGSAKACPDDVYAAAATVCNPSMGECDPAEACSGNDAQCPTDLLLAADTVCNAAVDSCDSAEVCDGETAACPTDEFQATGSSCSLGDGTCTTGPCGCDSAHVCEDLCGNGVVDSEEACDSADGLADAIDHCKSSCLEVCDVDASWVRSDGGSGQDTALDIAVNAAGSSWLVGHYQAAEQAPAAGPNLAPGLPGTEATFGDTLLTTNSDGLSQGFIMMTGPDNAPQWAACIGTPDYGFNTRGAEATGVAVDRHDNAFVVGHFGQAVTFGCCDTQSELPSAPGLCPTYIAGGPDCGDSCNDTKDLFLSQWDANGNLVWATTGGTPNIYEMATSVATTPRGEAVIAAYTVDDLTWDGVMMPAIGGGDAVVVSFDTEGKVKWGKAIGGPAWDTAKSVAVDGMGDIYVCGHSEDGALSIDGVDLASTNGGGAFVAKVLADGTPQWATVINSNGYADCHDVAIAGDGSIYFTGNFQQHLDWGLASSDADSGLFVAKLDVAGAIQWAAATEGTSPVVGPLDIAIDRRGRTTIAGSFTGTINFGPYQVSTLYSGDMPLLLRAPFVARLDTDGMWMWAKGYLGQDGRNAAFAGLSQTPTGGIWVGGTFEGTLGLDGDPVTAGNHPDTVMMPTDVLVTRLMGDADCEQCGDGNVGPGEMCDDGDGDSCGGDCDGVCFGPANSCGDGWVDCDEDYDLGGGSPDDMMCVIREGGTWCFQDADNLFTLLPTDSGVAAAAGGPGTSQGSSGDDFGGNLMDPQVCPDVADPRSVGLRQWGGDMPNPSPDSSGRLFCDNSSDTAPSVSPPADADGLNSEAAAIECGDYYEFVANTGADVAFEFDEHSVTQGPSDWSVWVSISGDDGSWERVLTGQTTDVGAVDFGAGVAGPMHTAYLNDVMTSEGSLNDQRGVHFRIYAWGALATDAPFVVDNVRVGVPRIDEPAPMVPVVIISEIVDGDLSGGLPKVLELTNVGTGPADLSNYKLGKYPNGGSLNSVITLSGTLAAGESYVVSGESNTFTSVYGTGPDLVNAVANNNGDDGVVLLDANDNILDTYGVIGKKGDNEFWDYTDSWAHRKADALTPRAVMLESDWTFGGREALDGQNAAAHAAATSPGSHAYNAP